MKRHYLLDTGIAQDYQCDRGDIHARVISHRRQGHRVGICTPVLGELWAGVEGSSSRERNARILSRAISQLVLWPYTESAAEEFGRIFTELRRSGRMIQQVDIQIAAIARTLPNCVIVSKDTDFLAIPGIAVENWAS